MPKRAHPSIVDQLRAALAESGENLNAVASGSGLDHGQLYRFNAGQRTLTIESAAKLAAYLGLELRKVRAGARPA